MPILYQLKDINLPKDPSFTNPKMTNMPILYQHAHALPTQGYHALPTHVLPICHPYQRVHPLPAQR
jgi:hypothetical protein